MEAGSEDGVFLDIAKLFLPVKDSDLVLFEDVPLLVLVTILNAVHPLDDDWLFGRGRLCLLNGRDDWGCATRREDEHGKEKGRGADSSAEFHGALSYRAETSPPERGFRT
jgi:hypothetical protein